MHQFVSHAVAAVFIATNAPENLFNYIWVDEAPLQRHRCCKLFCNSFPTECRIIEIRFLQYLFPVGFVAVHKVLSYSNRIHVFF